MSNIFTLIIIKLELIFIKKYLIEMFVINFNYQFSLLFKNNILLFLYSYVRT